MFTTGSLTCTSGQACWKNSKNYACKTTQYLKSDGYTCQATCDGTTNPHQMPNLASTYSGNCTSKCNTSVTCQAARALNDQSQFTCKTLYTRSYFFCFANLDNDKGAMHYGSMFSPPNIQIPVSPSMNNYHIEIWFLPDARYLKYSSSTGFYFFETNAFYCKKTAFSITTVNDFACYNGSNNTKIGTDVTMKFLNWHRLAFTVTGSGTSFTFSFHFNKYNAATASQSVSSSLALSHIKFCTVGCSNKLWLSGFYKWLKIYDATYLPLTAFKAKDVM